MWVLYNNEGKVITNIPHGEIVRQGSHFSIYIAFDKTFFEEMIGEESKIFSNSMLINWINENIGVQIRMESFPIQIPLAEFKRFKKIKINESVCSFEEDKGYVVYKFEGTPEFSSDWGEKIITVRMSKIVQNDDGSTIEYDVSIQGQIPVYIEQTYGNISQEVEIKPEQIDYLLKAMQDRLKLKLNVADEKVYRFDKTYTSYNDFATDCLSMYYNTPKIFYGTYSVGGDGTYDLVGICRRQSKVLILSGSGELVLTDGNSIEFIKTPKLSITDSIDITKGIIKVKTPNEDDQATPKKYVDDIKRTIENSIENIKDQLIEIDEEVTEQSVNPVTSEGIYNFVDSKTTETLESAINSSNLNINKKISDVNNTITNLENDVYSKMSIDKQTLSSDINKVKNDLEQSVTEKTARNNLIETIGNVTNEEDGLLNHKDYETIMDFITLLQSGDQDFVDNIKEVLEIFQQYPEGTNLINLLRSKTDKTVFEEHSNEFKEHKEQFETHIEEYEALTAQVQDHIESYELLKDDFNSFEDKTDKNINNINNKLTFTNLTPTPSTLGGIGKGQTFENVLITDILNNLLYPYVAFSFTISTSPSAGVKEFNKTINVTSATVKITKGSAELSTVEVYNGSTLIGSKIENVVDGNNTITFENAVALSGASTDGSAVYRTIKAVVTDSTGAHKEQSATFTFVFPYYYGAISGSTTLTESLITGLTNVVTTKASKSYTITMNQQKAVYAYPSSYGNLTKILDANSFDVTETFVKNTLTIHGVSYNVYVLDTPATSQMKYTFNY